MGKSQREKGARFERRIARWLSKVLGRDVHRQTNETQQGNVGDVRVQVGSNLTLVIQAKHRQAPSPWSALAEAEASATSRSDIPVACIRRHGGEDLVVMRPDVFAMLLADFDATCRAKGDALERTGW